MNTLTDDEIRRILDEQEPLITIWLNEIVRKHPNWPANRKVQYSMRAIASEVCERDPDDMPGFAEQVLRIAGLRRSPNTPRYVRAAVLDEDEIASALSLFKGATLGYMRHLLLDRRNNPTNSPGIGYQTKINGALRGVTIGGNRLRLGSSENLYQLWVVED